MIQKAMIRSLIVCSFFLALMAFYFLFLQSANKKKEESAHQTMHQDRKCVTKQIWLSIREEQPYLKVFCKNSILSLLQKGSKFDCIETMYDLDGYMIQNPSKEFGQVKYFQSPKGIYFFQFHEFLLENLSLSFFEAKKGQNISSHLPMLSGKCEKASIFLTHPFAIEATNFHATFFPKREEK